ncbi:BQ5605_C012g06952 [Microbotryum silenes-dioicae]|uniref:BQ5605_C012g06952 protein n=1 Tax=Microbotryum silenes-dioicae TaxID=796604 RepID=A0A2X0LWZ6_9BASI|nr:BQ5605_C012g06952 [Microbotryum silenes-dioicae]
MAVCTHCRARHWECEGTKSTGNFSTCCSQGKVQPPPSLRPNPNFQQLLEGSDSEAKAFRRSARIPGRTITRCRPLRSLPTLTRLDQALKDPACFGYFVVFTIDSAHSRRHDSCRQSAPNLAETCQLICPAEATDTQLGPDGADKNRFVGEFTSAKARAGWGTAKEWVCASCLPPGRDRRTHNLPTWSTEMAMLIRDSVTNTGNHGKTLSSRCSVIDVQTVCPSTKSSARSIRRRCLSGTHYYFLQGKMASSPTFLFAGFNKLGCQLP